MSRTPDDPASMIWEVFSVLLPFIAGAIALAAFGKEVWEPVLRWCADGFLMGPTALFALSALEILLRGGTQSDVGNVALKIGIVLILVVSVIFLASSVQHQGDKDVSTTRVVSNLVLFAGAALACTLVPKPKPTEVSST